jgi:hypothetical protein
MGDLKASVVLLTGLLAVSTVACSAEMPEEAESRLTGFVTARWTQSAERLHEYVDEETRAELLEKFPKASEAAPRVEAIESHVRDIVAIDVQKVNRKDDVLKVTVKVTQPEDLQFREKIAMVSFQAEAKAGEDDSKRRAAARKAVGHLIETIDIDTKTSSESFELRKQNGEWRVVADIDSMSLGRGFHVRDYGKNPLSDTEKEELNVPDPGEIEDEPLAGSVDGRTFELASGYAEKSDRDKFSYELKLFSEDVPKCELPSDVVSIQVNLPAGDPAEKEDEIQFVGFTLPRPTNSPPPRSVPATTTFASTASPTAASKVGWSHVRTVRTTTSRSRGRSICPSSSVRTSFRKPTAPGWLGGHTQGRPARCASGGRFTSPVDYGPSPQASRR